MGLRNIWAIDLSVFNISGDVFCFDYVFMTVFFTKPFLLRYFFIFALGRFVALIPNNM